MTTAHHPAGDGSNWFILTLTGVRSAFPRHWQEQTQVNLVSRSFSFTQQMLIIIPQPLGGSTTPENPVRSMHKQTGNWSPPRVSMLLTHPCVLPRFYINLNNLNVTYWGSRNQWKLCFLIKQFQGVWNIVSLGLQFAFSCNCVENSLAVGEKANGEAAWPVCALLPTEWNESVTWLPLCINIIACYLTKKIQIFIVTDPHNPFWAPQFCQGHQL